ncbi:MAG: alanine--tRNA ligase [Alphaproteobacteria bacterium]|nr:alanine--tRNA ligase [Alphaproteobacteria bacterium]NCQ67359.1 alanine--tRNA ligase [Alphaproteobacteria bacterium]NCT06674.1 alanine--tRNA ligase [Alphaproteobacteria bacterium]
MWTTNKIRQSFLDFFKSKGHEVVRSAPLVPQNDPTLMFVNAGMVPFKNVFTGLETRPYKSATSSQKCVRAGGKHNDLENVGYTARHHTFFEMLGNFSFGGYFKEHAITYAWEFLTDVLGIDKNRLVVTVYHTDDEAAELWKKIAGLNNDRIIRISTNDNFWSMGDTGPCGPCSEIFYDHGSHIQGGLPGTPEEDGDRFVEIWNLVFMQYNQLDDGTQVDLPNPSIDTGAGLERLAAVLQNTHDNYEIDLFKHLIQTSIELTGRFEAKYLTSHRIIADHLRSGSFLIADGVLPSNEGRGYVLRRIMRRAMRHAYLLGAKEPLIYRLAPTLITEMGEAYPELARAQALITETLKLEEERFRRTLGRGLKLLEEEQEKLSHSKVLPGDIAFKLYDTYGFPLDLTQDILRSHNQSVDIPGFNAAMEEQKAEARQSWSGSGEEKEEAIWFELAQKLPPTEFLGYSHTTAQGQVLALVQQGKSIEKATRGDVFVIMNQTPFYAESGGQVGDQGRLTAAGFMGLVTDCTKKAGKLFVHRVALEDGSLSVGDVLELLVDEKKRNLTKANHSATHLLHATLRHYLGDQVVQKGSLVGPNRLRFDFSFNSPLSSLQLQAVEDQVNDLIRANSSVQTKIMIPDDALKVGAMALFGEKYGEEVRVLSMGKSADTDHTSYSVEFCGGTHVKRTGDIGYFKITSESGVAAGVRRIEAQTGPGAEAYARGLENISNTLSARLKTKPSLLTERLEALIEEKRNLERDLKKLKEKLTFGGTDDVNQETTKDIKIIGAFSYLAKTLEDSNPQDLKPAADAFKKQIKSGVIVLGSNAQGKASLVVAVTEDLTDKISAVDLVRIGSKALGGTGGGGRPDMAQAGGPDVEALANAYGEIEKALTV